MMDSNRKLQIISRRNVIVVVICSFIVIFGIYSYPDLHALLRKGEEVAEARAFTTPTTSEQHESVLAQVQGW